MVLRSEHTLGKAPAFKLRLSMHAVQIFVIFVLFISFLMYGVGGMELFSLSIAPWDLAILGLTFLWATLLFYRPLRIRKNFIPALILALFFTLWLGISAFFSPQPERALTMILLQLRNLVLLLAIGTLFSDVNALGLLNRKLFWIGGIIASFAILMYISALPRYWEILSDLSQWKPGIGYVLDQGGVLRLIGFAKDPNFYSLWIAPSFLAGLSLAFSPPRLVMMIIIGLSLALAMSRGFALAFAISTIIVIVALLALRRRSVYIKRLVGAAAISVIIAIGLTSAMGYDFLSMLEKRAELASQSPRYAMWHQILSETAETWNPLIGAGLRGTEEILEGAYSHNSYLDVLFETGLVGLLIWTFLMGYTTFCALRRIKYQEWSPWVHSWFILIVMFAFFSLAYHPFTWLIVGILTASPFKQRGAYLVGQEKRE
jgi:O-antigen ligase